MVNARNGVMCDYTVATYGTKTGNTYDITLVYTQVAGTPVSGLVAHFVITESGFPVSWGQATEANYVCREMVPSASGTPLDFSSSNVVEVNLSFNWNPVWVVGHCEFVSFLQNVSTKEILQGGKTPVMFLQPPPPPLAAGFSSDVTSTCEASEVQYYDESAGIPTSWDWTFEGGDPASSTEQDPLVTYNTAGTYDVTLTVTKGTENSTTESVDYMTVNVYPDEPTITQEEYTLVSSAEEGNQWYLEGEIIPDAINQNYTPTEGGNYSVMVTENGCGTISQEFYFSMVGIGEMYSQQEMTVFPSPSMGSFTVNLNSGTQETVDMRIYNSMKSQVYEQEGIHINGQYKRTMDLGDLPNGMYFIVIEGLEKSYIQKIIIQK